MLRAQLSTIKSGKNEYCVKLLTYVLPRVLPTYLHIVPATSITAVIIFHFVISWYFFDVWWLLIDILRLLNVRGYY